METILGYWLKLRSWWYGQADVTVAPTSNAGASRERVEQTLATVERAAASMMNAYREHSTVTAVRYHDGGTYLIASAHATNNRFQDSKGFDYKGRKLFPIIKGEHVAFAEHIAVNLQGSICDATGNLPTQKPFQEISILKLLDPEQTADALHMLSFGSDSSARLKNVLGVYPDLAFNRIVMPAVKEAFESRTRGFSLTPLTMSALELPSRDEAVYSVAYHDNMPHRVRSEIAPEADQYGVQLKFRCENPIIGGHSGSLLFQVTNKGAIVPVGVVAATDGRKLRAYATQYSEVERGLQVVSAGRMANLRTSIDHICTDAVASNVWYSPTAIAASAMARPADAPPTQRPVVPVCR